MPRHPRFLRTVSILALSGVAAAQTPASRPVSRPASTPASRPSSAPAALRVGDAAPTFTLADHTGKTWRLAELKGKRVVLWFYPKADTPG